MTDASTALPLHNPPARTVSGSLGGLTWAHFLNDGAANFLPGVLPLILVTMGLSVSLAGALMAALLAGQALQPATGWLVDRIGGRALITVGLLGSSLGGILIGLSPTLWMLIPSLALIGVCNACFHPPAMASARQLGGTRQGRALSILLVGGEIGRGLWPLLATAVVSVLGLKWVGLLCVPGVISAALLWRWTPELPRRNAHSQPIIWRSHVRPLSVLVGTSSLRSLMIIATSTFLPILWHQRGSSLMAGAGVITTMLLIGIIGNLAGGHLADHFGRRTVMLASLALAVPMLALILLASGVVMWLALGLFGIAVFATLPVTTLFGLDTLPENRALGSGFAMGFGNALAALGVAALGPVAAHYGVLASLWITVIGGAVALLLAFGLPRSAAHTAS